MSHLLDYLWTFNLAGISFVCFCLLYPCWAAFDESRRAKAEAALGATPENETETTTAAPGKEASYVHPGR